MSIIEMVESRLPPGFRFHPKDEELICDYLMKKVTSSESSLFIEVDLNKCEPWDIPDVVHGVQIVENSGIFYLEVRWHVLGAKIGISTTREIGNMQQDLEQIGQHYLDIGRRQARTGRSLARAPLLAWRNDLGLLPRVFNKSRSEAAGKAITSNMGNGYYDNMNMGSSTLPPLVDSYINFDQTEIKLNEYEQVPCFSDMCSPNPSNLVFPHITHMEPHLLTKTIAPIFGGMPDLGTFSCDKMVIKTVLNQLSNVEESPSFGEGSSSESYLSEVALPPIWNHYC
uniref:NAC domain-containing protein n=1 Tax=Vitis vinifera TaxID=29760 RepID=A5BYT9_VITVI|nr:hypothetical protein VITISV_027052 [Vitis vinifera]